MAAIDRIDGLTPHEAGVNNNRRVQSSDAKEGAEFSLPKEEHEGVIYEPGTPPKSEAKTIAQVREEIAREEAAAAKANLHARFDGPGVAVELSTEYVAPEPEPAQQSIGQIFRDAWRSIVAFFSAIWNGGEEKADAAADAAAGDVAAEVLPTAADATSGTTEAAGVTAGGVDAASRSTAEPRTRAAEAEAFMADYGGGHLAKNSDLLTQYDRKGHIVSVDPTDRRRILQGDTTVRKY